MTRNAVRNYLVLGCLVSLSLFHLLWPALASQPVELDAKILDTFVARNIGPANMGGRITSIAGYDKEPNIVYVGAASGGLWKTTDSGDTWMGLFDNQTSVCIGDVAVCQSNPNIVWIGTGEANSRNSVAWGDGVYKSTDGGKSWQHMGLKDSHSIARIAINPTNPDIVYVAVLGHTWGPNKERGIFKTADGGKTWHVSKFLDEDTGFIELKMDPTDPDILYAAGYCVRRDAFSGGNPRIYLGPHAGLYKTTDGGKTWDRMTTGLPAEAQFGRCGLDIYAKDPNVLYAVVQTDKTPVSDSNVGGKENGKTGPAAGGIFRSDDKGKTWKHINSLIPRPFYFGQIRIDPTDDKRIFVLGVQMYISTDAGKTFTAFFSSNMGNPANNPHADHHALWINPLKTDEIFDGNDGGIWRSRDNAKTFQALLAMPIGQYYGISCDMNKPYYVYGGLQDNGGWGGPSATYDQTGIRQNLCFSISGGDGFHTQNDPTDNNTVFTESQNGNPTRVTVANMGGKGAGKGGKGGMGGGGFGGMGGGIGPKGMGARFNWSTPMQLSPHDPKTLFYGGHFLLMSTQRGENWKRISPNLTYGPDFGKGAGESRHTLFTLAESPRKKGVIWTGADDGAIFVTRDAGESWTDVSAIPGFPKDSCVSRVEPSYHDDGTCYVSITRYRNDDRRPYIFKTTDYGATWQNITSNLPESGSVHVVIESSRNKNLLFCGTEFGLFVTLDAGKTWHRMKGGMPTVSVHDLVIHPRDRDLVVGTHGRSIFIFDNIGPLEEMTPDLLMKPANLYAVRPTVAFKWTSSPPPKSNEFVGENPAYGALIYYGLKTAQAQPVSISILDGPGKQVAVLRGEGTAGLHKIVWDLRAEGTKDTPVAAGDYWARLMVGGLKQYQKIRVEAQPVPDKKAEEKKAEDKKAEDKKVDDKKAEDKKVDDKKADVKKAEDKKADIKKGDDKDKKKVGEKVSAGDKNKDRTDLQGGWKVLSAELDGKPLQDTKDAMLVITGDTFTLTPKGAAAKPPMTIKLDATQKPCWFDIDLGPGIYFLEEDTLKLCFGKEGRPTEFTSQPARYLLILEREICAH